MPSTPQAEISLSSGETVTVQGTVEDVEKALSDASRSATSRLAWFTELGGKGLVGVNPAHVAALRDKARE